MSSGSAIPPTFEEGAEAIYSGNVPFVLKHADREDRQTTLTVAMSYTLGQPRNQKVLHVQLTDEGDHLLLYNLDISEDDFHTLKTEQSILVDFPTFPSKFIELLRHCQAAAGEEHPHFVAVLSTTTGTPVCTVIETNPFRQIAHLALRLVAGNDAAIKKHLAGRVGDYKAHLEHCRDELGERTSQLQETAELAAQQTGRLRTIEEDHTRSMNELEVRHQGAVAAAKEQATLNQQEQLRLADQERARVVERAETELSSVRQSLSKTAADLAQLTSSHHELELKLRERTSRLDGAEQEVALLKHESTSLRDENAKLAAEKHRLEKALAAREVELAASIQSVKDKAELLSKQSALHEAGSDAKRQLDTSLADAKDANATLAAKLAASTAEITKGNAIIHKLQNDGRALKAKLRLKAAVLLQQQEHAQQKQSELDGSEREQADMRTHAAELRADKERAQEALAASKQQLAEAQDLLRTNQQVIQWLNKELNEAQTGGKPYINLPSRVTSFKPAIHPALRPSLSPSGGGFAASATGTSAVMCDPTPLSAPSSLTASMTLPAAAKFAADAADADGYVPGKALANLKSRAGMAFAAEGTAGTNTTGGFSDYLAPAPIS